MHIDGLTTDRLAACAGLIARCQADPRSHIGYDSSESDAISAELAGLEPKGLDGVVVATIEGEVVGLLAAEWDDTPPRCWWHGPYVDGYEDWDVVADALFERARAMVPATVTEHELGPDGRNDRVGAFARRHGFHAEEGSAVMTRQLDGTPWGLPEGDGSVTIRPLADADRVPLALLHDDLFPGTHTTGARLAAGGQDRVIVVASGASGLIGYAVGELEADGSAYLDFLGVAPQVQRRGLGAALVAALGTVMDAERGCPALALTVRESNEAARRLYRRLGFVEERILRPWRLGFSLAGS